MEEIKEFQLHDFEIYVRKIEDLYEMRFPENGSVLQVVFLKSEYASEEVMEREFVDALYNIMSTTIKQNHMLNKNLSL